MDFAWLVCDSMPSHPWRAFGIPNWTKYDAKCGEFAVSVFVSAAVM
jgi:hypothetical protein